MGNLRAAPAGGQPRRLHCAAPTGLAIYSIFRDLFEGNCHSHCDLICALLVLRNSTRTNGEMWGSHSSRTKDTKITTTPPLTAGTHTKTQHVHTRTAPTTDCMAGSRLFIFIVDTASNHGGASAAANEPLGGSLLSRRPTEAPAASTAKVRHSTPATGLTTPLQPRLQLVKVRHGRA